MLDARIKGGERHMIMSNDYDKVFPMVPAGAPIEEVFDAEDLAKKEK